MSEPMATTQCTDSKPVGTVDAQTHNSARTVVTDVVTEDLQLAEWDVFRTVAECSEDTVHQVRQ
jgi:hypothetical protein